MFLSSVLSLRVMANLQWLLDHSLRTTTLRTIFKLKLVLLFKVLINPWPETETLKAYWDQCFPWSIWDLGSLGLALE